MRRITMLLLHPRNTRRERELPSSEQAVSPRLRRGFLYRLVKYRESDANRSPRTPGGAGGCCILTERKVLKCYDFAQRSSVITASAVPYCWW
jgi:hypothetical protein